MRKTIAMDQTDYLLMSVAKTIYEEEGLFFVTLDADKADLPLEGIQRLVIGGKATPKLEIMDAGIEASLSFNHIHHDIFIPWSVVSGVEGNFKVFFCNREGLEKDEADTPKGEKKKTSHLKVVK